MSHRETKRQLLDRVLAPAAVADRLAVAALQARSTEQRLEAIGERIERRVEWVGHLVREARMVADDAVRA